jgi:opacity protein-like surface antigen
MRPKVLTIALCFACIPLTMPAQAALDIPRARWSLSLGVDPTHFDLRTRDPGVDARFAATGARLWHNRNPALTTHVGLMLGGDAPRALPETEISPELDVSRYYAALTAGGAYEFSLRSRVRPYVSAGGGGYFNDVGWKIACTGATCDPRVAKYQQRFRETTFGVNGGVGLNVSFKNNVLFVEQRFHAFDVTRLDNGVHPLSVGVRF